MLLPLSAVPLVAAMLVVFAAGIVRGFSGFGFSALCVAALSLFLPPAAVVPPVFMLEVLASVSLLRGALRDADRSWLPALVLGNALCIPLGVAALAFIAEAPLRLLIGALLLLAAGSMRAGVGLALRPTTLVRLGTGMVCGLVNGVAAIGGIAVALLLGATPMPAAAMRGTMIVLFLFTDLYALLWAALLGGNDAAPLLGQGTWLLAAWLAPPMLAGIWLGQRRFAGVSQAAFRRQVLNLLLVIAALAVLRALLALGL